jgi:hypothetical protein
MLRVRAARSLGKTAHGRDEGNTMSACSQCGTVAKATDRFCNVCGTPLARASAPNAPPPAPAGPQYAPTPPAGPSGGYSPQPPPAAFGGAPVARCQMGHEIAPGASYCAQNHPIALDQMQFSNEAYGGGAQGFGQRPAQGAYGAPQQQPPGGYAPPPQQAYAPQQPPPQQAYAPQPPPQQAYAPPPGPPYGAPQGGPPAYAPQPNYAPGPPGGYGAPPAPAPFGAEAAAPPKILRGFLVAYATNPNGDFWPLTGGRLLVGRLGTNEGIDISMQDPTISSRHAAMVVDAASGSIVVEDTGSTNGTFVNDEHIGFNGRRELRDGDRLRFGGYTAVAKIIGRV